MLIESLINRHRKRVALFVPKLAGKPVWENIGLEAQSLVIDFLLSAATLHGAKPEFLMRKPPIGPGGKILHCHRLAYPRRNVGCPGRPVSRKQASAALFRANAEAVIDGPGLLGVLRRARRSASAARQDNPSRSRPGPNRYKSL